MALRRAPTRTAGAAPPAATTGAVSDSSTTAHPASLSVMPSMESSWVSSWSTPPVVSTAARSAYGPSPTSS
eukprot:10443381-Lingulodinium_polyedra.AAC.1